MWKKEELQDLAKFFELKVTKKFLIISCFSCEKIPFHRNNGLNSSPVTICICCVDSRVTGQCGRFSLSYEAIMSAKFRYIYLLYITVDIFTFTYFCWKENFVLKNWVYKRALKKTDKLINRLGERFYTFNFYIAYLDYINTNHDSNTNPHWLCV